MKPVASRNRLVEGLLRQVEQADHPSPQLLDRVERSLTSREAAEQYVDALLAKSATAHPSLRILDRAERIVRRIELSQGIEEARSSNHDQERKEHS